MESIICDNDTLNKILESSIVLNEIIQDMMNIKNTHSLD